MGSRTLSQFLVWLLDSNSLPSAFRDQIYAGMWDELESRGKVIQTDPDEDAMKVRWVKQRLHAEFNIMREMLFGRQSEIAVDLDLLGGIDEAEQGSVTKEAEEVAVKFLKDLDYGWSPENSSGDAIAEKDAEIARAVQEQFFREAGRLQTIRDSLEHALPAEGPAARKNSRRGHRERNRF